MSRDRTLLGLVFLALAFVLALANGRGQTRIKDVATVEGARENQLIGYGLVAGLDGQGDSDKLFTQQTVSNLARRFGIQIQPTDITNKNVALVMVTCKVPPFTPPGTKLNVTVASLADAKGAPGRHPAPDPAHRRRRPGLRRCAGQRFPRRVRCRLRRPRRLERAEEPSRLRRRDRRCDNGGNHPRPRSSPRACCRSCSTRATSPPPCAWPTRSTTRSPRSPRRSNATTVDVYVPREMQCPEKQMEFVARIENALFVPDVNARIVINERTGTVVANANIQISKIAVAFGNLTVSIASNPEVSQPKRETPANTYVDPGYGGDPTAGGRRPGRRERPGRRGHRQPRHPHPGGQPDHDQRVGGKAPHGGAQGHADRGRRRLRPQLDGRNPARN